MGHRMPGGAQCMRLMRQPRHNSTGDLVCDRVCDSRLVFLPLSGSQMGSGKHAAFERSSSKVKVGGRDHKLARESACQLETGCRNAASLPGALG